jgi:NitT/TauT family transport system substrate-binding protein
MTAANHPAVRSAKKTLARTGVALAAAAALTLTACSTAAPALTDAQPADELTKVVVVTFLPLESLSFTPEMVAYSGGYFEKYGLDVQLQPVQGTAAAIQTVIGGAAPITRASTVDLMPAMEQGQPLVGVGTMTRQTVLRIASTQDDPIESPEDMVGKTIGMGSVGGTSEKMLDLALLEAGVDKTDVARQAIPVTAATYELVKQGKLSGYIVSLDTALAIKNQNADAVISPAGLDTIPDMQVFVTTPTHLENQPEVIEAFLAAIAEATAFVVDDAANDFEETLTLLRDSGDWEFPALFDDEVAKEGLGIWTTSAWMDDSGLPLLENDLDGWVDSYDFLTNGKAVKGGGDPVSWITNDYIPVG